MLKRRYPEHYRVFGAPIRAGVVWPSDYLILVFAPIVVPLVLLRYLWRGQRDLKIFFTKWPVYFFVRRWHIWHQAWRMRIRLI